MKKVKLIFIFTFIISFSLFAQPSPRPRILGVVMGISKYQNVPSLKYADRDAMLFYNFLLSPAGGGADTNNIRLLLNEKATSYNFFEAMDNLLDMAKEGDQVYIYFAGHGDIEKKTERQNGFLICYSSPPNCYAAGGSILVTLLQDYVSSLVSKNKSKVTLIIDACRSGKLAGGSEGAELTALALKQEWKGVTKILSCQPGETSLEGDNWGGGAGVFTYFMLRGLKGLADEDGDGKISVRELDNFLDMNVTKETGNKQIPDIVGDKRQDIAKVDKKTYLGMLNQMEKPISIPPEKESAGFEADKSSIDDIKVLKEYEKFQYNIINNNLLAYNDADKDKETALSIYRSLESRRTAQPIISKMKGELLAALQNRAQNSINKYMNSEISIIRIDNPVDSLTRYMTYSELKTALGIADSTYPHYNQLKFRYLFYSHTLEKDTVQKLKILEECLKISPNEAIVYNAIGIIKDDINKKDEALNYFKRASELAPNWPTALNNIGSSLNELGKNEEGIKYIDKAIEIKPDFANGWDSKGYILSELGKYEEAIKCYDEAIKIKSDFYTAWFNKGNSLINLGKPEEAIKCFDKAIEIKSDYDDAWLNKGITLTELVKFEEAIKCYDEALKIKPDGHIAWSNKAIALRKLRKFEEAIKCNDEAIKIKPDDNIAWYNKGIIFINSGKYEEALKCFNKTTVFNPQDYISWLNKGYVLDNIGKPEEAIICYDKAIEINPNFYEALTNKGNALLRLANYEEAIKCFDRVIEMKSDYTDALSGKGKSLVYLGKFGEAIKYYDKAIELRPNDSYNWNDKGFTLSRLGKFEESIKCLDKAIEINPNNWQAWFNKGYVYSTEKKYEEAIISNKNVLELNPNEVITYYNLSCVYSIMKNKPEMLKYLKKAIELNPKFKIDAPKDEDFKEYWNDPDFLELLM